MPEEYSPVTRSLFAWEILEARLVFGNQLAYERVRVHECTSWPDLIDRISRLIRGLPAPISPNAVTLGYHCHFPVRLLQQPVPPDHLEHPMIGWLIHELTHAWQYQHRGWFYLLEAVRVQFQENFQAYDFGGETGLRAAAQQNQRFKDFNPEQQGEICRTYYVRLTNGMDISAWQPFIDEIQSGSA